MNEWRTSENGHRKAIEIPSDGARIRLSIEGGKFQIDLNKVMPVRTDFNEVAALEKAIDVLSTAMGEIEKYQGEG